MFLLSVDAVVLVGNVCTPESGPLKADVQMAREGEATSIFCNLEHVTEHVFYVPGPQDPQSMKTRQLESRGQPFLSPLSVNCVERAFWPAPGLAIKGVDAADAQAGSDSRIVLACAYSTDGHRQLDNIGDPITSLLVFGIKTIPCASSLIPTSPSSAWSKPGLFEPAAGSASTRHDHQLALCPGPVQQSYCLLSLQRPADDDRWEFTSATFVQQPQ